MRPRAHLLKIRFILTDYRPVGISDERSTDLEKFAIIPTDFLTDLFSDGISVGFFFLP